MMGEAMPNLPKKPKKIEVDLSGAPDEPVPGLTRGRDVYTDSQEAASDLPEETIPDITRGRDVYTGGEEEPSGAYESGPIKSLQSMADATAEALGSAWVLGPQWEARLENPNGKTIIEKMRTLKSIYAALTNLKLENPNISDIIDGLRHRTLLKILELDPSTYKDAVFKVLRAYPRWLNQQNIAPGQESARQEKIMSALADAEYLATLDTEPRWQTAAEITRQEISNQLH